MKKPISIRLEPEIIDFFKQSFPESYQKGISKVLARFVMQQRAATDFAAGRAQQIFRQYHAQCFWHLRKDLKITAELIPAIIAGLRRHGGKEGFQLAAELNQILSEALCR